MEFLEFVLHGKQKLNGRWFFDSIRKWTNEVKASCIMKTGFLANYEKSNIEKYRILGIFHGKQLQSNATVVQVAVAN